MQKLVRPSAALAALMLVLAACQPSASASPTESAAATGGEDPAAICAADEFGCVEVAAGDDILIGTALSITGGPANLGLDSQWGAEVAGNFKNDEGGVLGHQISWVHEDAGCAEAETGQTAAQSLVVNEQLVAVIGTSCSRTAVPAAPVLAGLGITLFSPANTSPTLTDPTSPEFAGEFYGRTAHNDLVQGAAVAKFACEQGFETAATVHDGSTYADNLRQVFEREFDEQCGGTITSQQAVAIGEVDMTAVLTTIAADSPDFLYYPIFHPEGTLLTAAAEGFPGLEDTQLGSSDGLLGDPNFLDGAGDASLGMVMSGPACAGDFYENTFLPAYSDVSGQDTPVSVFHCHAYDAANMIFATIEAVALEDADGTLFIPRTAFRDTLFATENYEGLTGILTCDENRDCADPDIRVSEIQEVDGELAWVVIWP
jgi:branched-chain amino acid transport system substrate-binding protein